MKKIFCDICHKQINEFPLVVSVKRVGTFSTEEYDLHYECYSKLVKGTNMNDDFSYIDSPFGGLK